MKIQHCDVSDPNIMFLVKDASPEAAVPDWPKEQAEYPKRPGMLGDWGYAADLKGNPVVRRMTVCLFPSCFYVKSQYANSLGYFSVHGDGVFVTGSQSLQSSYCSSRLRILFLGSLGRLRQYEWALLHSTSLARRGFFQKEVNPFL